jgi:hypothetical protein
MIFSLTSFAALVLLPLLSASTPLAEALLSGKPNVALFDLPTAITPPVGVTLDKVFLGYGNCSSVYELNQAHRIILAILPLSRFPLPAAQKRNCLTLRSSTLALPYRRIPALLTNSMLWGHTTLSPTRFLLGALRQNSKLAVGS